MPIPTTIDQISFDSLGQRTGLIADDMHKGVADLSGKYKHPELGELYVQQETAAEKNVVEWMFYQIAKAVLPASGQQDILDRMAPVILVTPHATNNSAKEIYVGTVSHKNMELMWKAVHAFIYPDLKVPERRPGGFEHMHHAEIVEFVDAFNKKDPGFSMLPVLALLGHHATHLGNLGTTKDGDHEKMLFFDYGAVSMYRYNNTNASGSELAGRISDYLAKHLLGVSKNYLDYYEEALDKNAVSKRMKTFYTSFQKNLDKISESITASVQRLQTILDKQSFLQFTHYVGIPPKTIAKVDNKDLANVVAKDLVDAILNKVNKVPAYLEQINITSETKLSSTASMSANLKTEASQPSEAKSQFKDNKRTHSRTFINSANTTKTVKDIELSPDTTQPVKGRRK